LKEAVSGKNLLVTPRKESVEIEEQWEANKRKERSESREEFTHSAHQNTPDGAGNIFQSHKENRAGGETRQKEIEDRVVEGGTTGIDRVGPDDKSYAQGQQHPPHTHKALRHRLPETLLLESR
jgi:hypothetical protein